MPVQLPLSFHALRARDEAESAALETDIKGLIKLMQLVISVKPQWEVRGWAFVNRTLNKISSRWLPLCSTWHPATKLKTSPLNRENFQNLQMLEMLSFTFQPKKNTRSNNNNNNNNNE